MSETLKSGLAHLFDEEEEADLVNYLKLIARVGYGYSRPAVIDLATHNDIYKELWDSEHPISTKWMRPELLVNKTTGADGDVSESGWSNTKIFRNYMENHLFRYIPYRTSDDLIVKSKNVQKTITAVDEPGATTSAPNVRGESISLDDLLDFDVIEDEEPCCCYKLTGLPKEQCTLEKHWVHLKYCCNKTGLRIHDVLYALVIEPQKRGQAQGVLGNLTQESRQDFKELVKALEDRTQLRERYQRAVEASPELGQDIRRLTNLAYATAPNEVRETLAKEQFIDSLIDSDMRLRIKQARPTDLNDAIRHAVELEAFNKGRKQKD
ncbi:unnamed protein product [Mytilus coruscus]|uniref:Uncharacterized protein n=1 Tax=Mytilus coruscus TaxID=42192 RepID=A0A6J8DZR1_MYTCO|nr:unnamed protein product [Mytilus coruscus]